MKTCTVVGNLLLYYQKALPGEPATSAKSVSPDLMVVLGASKRVRSSYVLWQEPKAPDFVLEIASESTYRIDRSEKRATYAGMGVPEYWQYDPVGRYLAPPLLGYRLVDGVYRPIPARVQSGGLLSLHSEVLGLELHLTPGAPVREALHFYDPVRGEYLRTYREEAQARWEADQAPGRRGTGASGSRGASGADRRAPGADRGPVTTDAGPFARRAGGTSGVGGRGPGTAARAGAETPQAKPRLLSHWAVANVLFGPVCSTVSARHRQPGTVVGSRRRATRICASINAEFWIWRFGLCAKSVR